jgi:DNA polymerase-3 subunit epsilon
VEDALRHAFARDLLVLDVETTGPDSQLHEVVEVGAVLLSASTLEPVKRFQSLVRPEQFRNADPHSLRIHGLSAEKLAGAPTARQVVSRFVEELGLGYIFCGWNIGFDTQFLRSLFRSAGRIEEFDRIDYHKLDLWSLLELAWVLGLCPEEPKSLTDVCRMFHIERADVHSALQDALIAAEVLRATILLLRMSNDEDVRSDRPIAVDNV